MKVPPFAARWIVAPLIALAVRLLSRTLKIELIGEEHFAAAMATDRPVVFAFWHEDLVGTSALYLRRNPEKKRVAAMVSHSRDGQLLARVLEQIGQHTIKGSSSKGGAAGLIEMVRWLKAEPRRLAAIAVDGPRGPRHVAKPGAFALARRAGALVLPLRFSFSSQWVFGSWDRMKLAKPFATMHCRFGAPAEEMDAETMDETMRGLGD